MTANVKSLVRLLLHGPFITLHKNMCNPYSSCSFNNGLWKWVWISSSNYKSLDIGVLQGILINANEGNVYRGYMVYPLSNGDGSLRFYLGPLIMKNVPLALKAYGSNGRLFSFTCKCGKHFEGSDEELKKHLAEKHAGLDRPSKLEIEAYVQISTGEKVF